MQSLNLSWIHDGHPKEFCAWQSPVLNSSKYSTRGYTQLRYVDVQDMTMHLLEQLSQALVDGWRIEVRGFGSFFLRYREPRCSRNPKTGEPIFVVGKLRPAFKAGKMLRERVLHHNVSDDDKGAGIINDNDQLDGISARICFTFL